MVDPVGRKEVDRHAVTVRLTGDDGINVRTARQYASEGLRGEGARFDGKRYRWLSRTERSHQRQHTHEVRTGRIGAVRLENR